MRQFYLLFIASITLSSCGLGLTCRETYKFKLPILISPEKETYRVGDTLTVTMQLVHDMVSDTFDSNFYNIPDLEPMITTNHVIIDSFPVIEELTIENFMYDSTALSFEFIDYSTLSRGVKNTQTAKTSTHTSFEFKTVLKYRGVHSISFRSQLRHFERSIDFEGKCPNSTIDGFVFINNHGRIINEHLLSVENQEVLDKYWEFRSATLAESSFFFFKVE